MGMVRVRAGFRLLVLCGLAAMLLGCARYDVQAVPVSRQVSGIEGHTTVGPTCPVMQAASPCPDRPQRARLSVTRVHSTLVIATAVSDGSGYFRIPLPPGRYVVWSRNLSRSVLPTAPPVTVVAVSGRFTVVTIQFDSGIR
jgi:hypothetical protein